MTVTDAQVSDAAQRLSRDLRNTGRAADVRLIEHFSANLRRLIDDPTYFVERLVEDVQQDILDGVEVWPPCPQHPNHPLWDHDGAWHCDQERTPIASLGSLS